MPLVRHPSLTSREPGFVPLDGEHDRFGMADNGIPLTTVRSTASTGARRPFAVQSNSFETESNDEKEQATPISRLHGRRRKPENQTLGRKETEGNARLNYMGRFYAKVIASSVITRYLVYIIPVGVLLAVPLIVLPLTDHKYDIPVGSNKNHQGPALFLLFLWIEITWLSLWAAKLASWYIPQFFMFFSGIVSVGTRKYATVLKNLELVLSLFFWTLATWLTFQNLFRTSNNNGISWVHTLKTILGALFVSSAVLLAEQAIVQLISVTYHQRSFANRIKTSKHDVFLLGLLFDASRTLFPMYCPEFVDEDCIINDSIEFMLRKKVGSRPKSGMATPLKLIGDVGRIGDKMTSAVGNMAHEITGKKVFNPNSAHSIVLEALEKLGPSEALARRIWMSFVIEGKDSLSMDDIQEVLGPEYKAEAEEAFYAIDSDANGDISLDEMIRKVVDIARERKAISEGMKDIGQALRAFDQILLFVVFLLAIFIFLAFFNSSFITTLSTAGTALLSLSFIFSITAQEFLGSCIFLFVKHPYDVGDRVDISAVQLVVDRISLLYTTFHRVDSMQVTQVPNIQLNALWIDNVSRSQAMYESIAVNVSFGTTFEDVEILRAEMEKFVRAPENARDFQPDFNINIGGVGDLDKLLLSISILHKSNWHNDAVRANRRSKFMCALALALKAVPIYPPGGGDEALGGPTNPTYSVAVSDQEAAQSREKASAAKEALRMVPSKLPSDINEARESDRQAAADLNTRPPIPEIGAWASRSEVAVEDQSSLGQRERDLDSVRNDLVKRQNTRGRRRAGESLPMLALTTSNVQMSRTQTQNSSHPDRLEPFDEEAEMGLSPRDYGATITNLRNSGNTSQRSGRSGSFARWTSQRSRASTQQAPSQGRPSQDQASQDQLTRHMSVGPSTGRSPSSQR